MNAMTKTAMNMFADAQMAPVSQSASACFC